MYGSRMFDGLVTGLILFGMALAILIAGLGWLVWWVLSHLQWVP
jgi:hypothetical protein